jgi:hypothetical protein
VNATGWKLWQWGSQACGLAGKTAAEIMLIYYYPGVTVSGAPGSSPSPVPSASLSPAPTPSPAPTATAAPASGTPLPAPTARATPSPAATATPAPVATPLPTPPPSQQLPGGGQTGVVGAVAPPPPPEVDPSPVVVESGDKDPTALAAFHHITATDIAGFVTESDTPDWRLAVFRSQWGPAAERLLTALTRGFAADGGLVLRFWNPL